MRSTIPFLLLLLLISCAPAIPAPRTVPVTETRYGITTNDPYRWMEGQNNAETAAWLRAQGEAAETWLARIPGSDALLRRLREIGLGTSASYGVQLAGRRMFYRSIGAGEQIPKLMVRGGRDRLLIDPTSLGTDKSHASINAYAPSPDGSLVAYDVALGGGEISTIRVMEVQSGNVMPEAIERVWGQFAANWLPDGSGFFYTQMAPPAPGVDPLLGMTVRLHILGQPVERDALILGRRAEETLPLAAEEFPVVRVDPATQWMIARAGGAHTDRRFYIAPLSSLDRSGAGKTPWKKVADYADSVEAVQPHGDRLYLRTFKDASNRKLISVPLDAPDLAAARVEIPESADATIADFAIARDALYIHTMVSGRSRLLRRPWDGAVETLTLPFDGAIDELTTDPLGDGAVIDIQGWTKPSAIFRYDTRAFAPTGLGTSSNADFSAIVADEVEATSADGTRVPLSILHRGDLELDGSHPAIVNGYGGYGLSATPGFDPTVLPWLERGGVSAICHVRGGGEKGHQWQVMGTHEHKINGIHDFEACAQYLIDHRFTSRGRVGAQGGSMGGVLVGRAITDRPDLFAAANIGAGLVNPLRILAAPNGANQKAELGDPETDAGYRAIYEMDPYQHVQRGTAYPAVLFTIGLNDRRVAPWMTAKMAARLQASTTSGKPVLVRVESDAGHGVGSTREQELSELADIFSFFLAMAGR